jgi:hypothetical protein
MASKSDIVANLFDWFARIESVPRVPELAYNSMIAASSATSRYECLPPQENNLCGSLVVPRSTLPFFCFTAIETFADLNLAAQAN